MAADADLDYEAVVVEVRKHVVAGDPAEGVTLASAAVEAATASSDIQALTTLAGELYAIGVGDDRPAADELRGLATCAESALERARESERVRRDEALRELRAARVEQGDVRSTSHASSSRPFVPLGPRAALAIVALSATGAVVLSRLWIETTELRAMRALQGAAPTSGAVQDLVRAGDLYVRIAIVHLCVVIVTGLCFVWWFRQAYRNLDSLCGERRFRAGWATGTWFVPILNLWRTKRIANDIWRGSDPWLSDLSTRTPSAVAAATGLVTAWWTTFLLTGFLNRGAARIFRNAQTATDVRNGAIAEVAATLCELAATALAVIVVLQITTRQQRRVLALATRV